MIDDQKERNNKNINQKLSTEIESDHKFRNPDIVIKQSQHENDTRLRILYLYQMLLTQSDEDHPLTTKQIIEGMKRLHNIHMHRTTVPSDIALLNAAGFEIIGERKRSWQYYLADRTFSIPELKILMDAVQSSKFITCKKSRILIEKLFSLTSETNAGKLQHTVHIIGRVKSDNEKGYYIVDAINAAMNSDSKISFYYCELDGNKNRVLKNNGNPYTVSPFDLIWDGDFYYLIGYCDEREGVRTFRVDRIRQQPEILNKQSHPRPENYDVMRYTTEAFRMFTTDETTEVEILCDNSVMNFVVDKFGMDINTESAENNCFRTKIRVCTGPTFYRWVFGASGKIRIQKPEEVCAEYKAMLQAAIDLL